MGDAGSWNERLKLIGLMILCSTIGWVIADIIMQIVDYSF